MNSTLLNAIDVLLAPYGARRLSSRELIEHPSKHKSCGWALEIEELRWKGETIVVWLLFDERPYRRVPSVYVVSPEIKPLEIPHLENHGKLCLWSTKYIIDYDNINYIKELLEHAVKLLSAAINGELDSHFEDEFISYWALGHECSNKFTSVLDLDETDSRRIVVKRLGNSSYIFGEDKDVIEKWLANQNRVPSKKDKNKYKKFCSNFERSVLVCFDHFITPKEYPCNLKSLIELVKKESAEESENITDLILDSFSMRGIAKPTILLLFHNEYRRALVSLTFQKSIYSRSSEYNHTTTMSGFRRQIPREILIARASQVSLKRGAVQRSDASWVMGRDSNKSRKYVSGSTVAVVGCGSLGSSVAKLLVKSGINDLILIDPDILNPENTSRHELGYDYTSMHKVNGLKDRLCKEFPHISVDVLASYIEQSDDVHQKIERANVVVSCTAEWHADRCLLKLQNKYHFYLVFAFVESHAMAGHVILNVPGSDAYTSLFYESDENIGSLHIPVTKWEDETMLQIPACAGEFQPYGAIEIAHVHALIAKTVVKTIPKINNSVSSREDSVCSSHTVWLGSSEDLKAFRGVWNSEWERKYGAVNEGNRVLSFEYVEEEWVHKNGGQI